MKDINDIIKNNLEVKWNAQATYSFSQIKSALSEAPILANRDYTKPFNIFSFASDSTIKIVLLQKNEDHYEQPFAFFSKVMMYVELKYDIIEKQAYALVQSFKKILESMCFILQ